MACPAGNDIETGVLTVSDVRDSAESPKSGDSVSAQEEAEIRERIRKRLLKREEDEQVLLETRKLERERLAEAERFRWQIIEEETEQFHRERDRKKYISSNGEVKWLTPEEFQMRRARRSRSRGRSRRASRRLRPGDWVQVQLRMMVASFAVSLVLLLIITLVIFAVEFV
jgi:hypothetical protein